MTKSIALMNAAVEHEIAQIGACWHLGRAAFDLEAFLAAAARPRYDGFTSRTRSWMAWLSALVRAGNPSGKIFVVS